RPPRSGREAVLLRERAPQRADGRPDARAGVAPCPTDAERPRGAPRPRPRSVPPYGRGGALRRPPRQLTPTLWATARCYPSSHFWLRGGSRTSPTETIAVSSGTFLLTFGWHQPPARGQPWCQTPHSRS